MKLHLILTIDYELFGNGSGCLDNCVLEPTRKCLATLDRFNAPLSFFVDATEFRAIKTEIAHHPSYPSIEEQLRSACATGHNLQLHLHPQWLNAEYNNQGWKLDFSKWRIGNLTQQEVDHAIESGLEYLKSLLGNEYDHERHLIAFRAGGWAIQPSDKVIPSLLKHGIQIDTTVAPDMYNPAAGDWFDFRKAPSLPFWRTNGDVCESSENGICEAPIATADVGYLHRARALREQRNTPALPPNCHGSYEGPNSRWQSLKEKAVKLCRMNTAMLDFCTTPSWLLIEITKRYMDRFKSHQGAVPLVAIGHNKNFSETSNRNLREWLEWANRCESIEFSDFDNWRKATGQN